MIKKILSLFLFLLCFLPGKGAIKITTSNHNKQINLEGQVYCLVDSANTYTFQEVIEGVWDAEMEQLASPAIQLPPNTDAQWYKITIENTTDEHQDFVFGLNAHLVQYLTFFDSSDSTYFTTGSRFPFTQRQILHKDFLIKVDLEPDQSADYILHLEQQENPIRGELLLASEKTFYDEYRSDQSVKWMLYTFIFFVFMGLSVLGLIERSWVYAYFSIYIIGVLIFRLWNEGLAFQFLWPNSPDFNLQFGEFAYVLSLWLYLLFIDNLYGFRRHSRKLRQFFVWLMVGLMSFLIINIFTDNVKAYFIFVDYLLIPVVVFFTIVGIILSYKQRMEYGRIYAAIIAIYIFSTILNVYFYGAARGFSGYNSTASTVALSTLCLGVYLIIIRKFAFAKKEIELINRNLEQRIQERTHKLLSQREELRSQHEELLLQKETLQTNREELRAQKELLQLKNVELEKLSLVASKTDNVIYILSPEGELDWFNSSFGHLVNLTMEEYQQLNERWDVTRISSNKNIKHVLNTCLREKTVVSYESKFEKQSGDFIWFHTTLTPILEEDESVKFLIAIDTNITTLKNYEAELNEQRRDAETQKELALSRKEELELRQNEITDSIRYAKRIQTAILPKAKQIQRDFYDSFVLFMPKDIVSGDFYWYHRIEDKYFVAAVDCTGHGVPGAFMSIIGNYLLNSIIIHNGVYDPAEILKQLNRKIKISLKTDVRSQTTDGMDLALAVIDKKYNTLEYAGALRPLFLFNEGRFIEVKGDKVPISSSISGTSLSAYTKHTFSFNPGDFFYIFSDGIIDQFGGKKGKKFLTKRFKELLFEINPLTMREQKDIIKKTLDDWRGQNEQVDDVLVIGLRYKDNE